MEGIYGRTMNVIKTKPSAKDDSGHGNGKSSTKVFSTNSGGAEDGSGRIIRKSSTKVFSTNSGGPEDRTNIKDDKRASGTQPPKKGPASGQSGEKYHGSPILTDGHGENPDDRHEGNAPVHKGNENFPQRSGRKKRDVLGDSTGTSLKQKVGNNQTEAVEQVDAFKSDTFDPLHTSVTSEEEGGQNLAESSGDSKPNMAAESNPKTDDGAKSVKGDKVKTKKNIRLYQSAKMHMKKLVTHKNSKVRVLDEVIEKNAMIGCESGLDKFSPNLISQESTGDSVLQTKSSEGEKSGRCKITIKALSSANRMGQCGGVYQGYSSTSLVKRSGGNLKDGGQTSREDKNDVTVSSITRDENPSQNMNGKTEVVTREINSGKKVRNNDWNAPDLKLYPPEVTGGALIEDVDTLEASPSFPAITSTKSDALKASEKIKPKSGNNTGAPGPNMVLENITRVNKTPFLLDKPKLAWSSPPSKVHNTYDDSGNNGKHPTNPECITTNIDSGECQNECQQESPDQTSPSQVTSLHSFNEEADSLDVMLKGFTQDVKHVLHQGDDDSFPRSANIEIQSRKKLKNNTKKMILEKKTDKNVTSGTKVAPPAKENLKPNDSRASAAEEELLCGVKTQLHTKKAKSEAKHDQELKTLQVKTVEDCWKVFMQNDISKSCSGESGDNLQKHNPLSWALASQSTNSTLNNAEKSGDSAKVADGEEQQKKEKGPSKLKKFKQIFTSSNPHNSWLPARHNFKPKAHRSAADEEARTKEKGHKVTPNMPGVGDTACDAAKTDERSAGNTVTVRNVSTLTKTAMVKSHKQLLEMFSVSNPMSANVT